MKWNKIRLNEIKEPFYFDRVLVLSLSKSLQGFQPFRRRWKRVKYNTVMAVRGEQWAMTPTQCYLSQHNQPHPLCSTPL